jgi:hypothetical protein
MVIEGGWSILNCFKMKFLVFSFIILFAMTSNATVYTTIANGSFTNKNTWSPSKPNLSWGSTDTLIIQHAVTNTANLTAYGNWIITSTGSYITTMNMTFDEGTLTNNGTIEVKNLTFNYSNFTIVNNGAIDISQSFSMNQGTFTNNGSMTVGTTFYGGWSAYFINNTTLEVGGNFTSYNSFTGSGSIEIGGSMLVDAIFSQSGNVTVGAGITNNGILSVAGDLHVGGSILNDWGNTMTVNGDFTVAGNMNNRGSMSLDGNTEITGALFSDWGTSITNSGSIVVTGSGTNKGTITNNGVIHFESSFYNVSAVHNNGNLFVDGSLGGAGSVDGTGTLCHSDGVTDPTGGGSKGNTVTCEVCSSGALPVELVSFELQNVSNQALITWSTASEKNSHYFEILRSIDNVNFEVVGIVQSAGNSNQLIQYRWIDTQPLQGVSYYKLNQVDFDGKSKKYDSKAFNNAKLLEVKVYPNPIASGQSITVQVNENQNTQLELFDITGKRIQELSFNSDQVNLETTHLLPGVYILRLNSAESTFTQRIIIQ